MCCLLELCYLLWYYYGCYTYYGIRRVPELVHASYYSYATYYGAGLGLASKLGSDTNPHPHLDPLYPQVDFRVQGRDKSRAFWQRRLLLPQHTPSLTHPYPITHPHSGSAGCCCCT